MAQFSLQSHEFPVLIGDIGGTNARFQIIETAQSDAVSFDPVKTSAFESVEEAIASSVLQNTTLVPRTAILAAAGPITPVGINLTNCDWSIDHNDFLKNGPFKELILMNDFEAQALALPFLESSDLQWLGGPKDIPTSSRTKAVLGPGTGLGVASLVRASGKWIPVAGEGGHVDLGSRTEREAEIWPHLETVAGRVSAEQILCGAGLVNLYSAICKADGIEPVLNVPAEITEAVGSNAQATETLSIFSVCLGRVAGDLAITTLAKGGVYLAGGVSKHAAETLGDGGFRKAFDDKGPHEEHMNAMPTWLIQHPLPALVGLKAYAQMPDEFAVDTDHRRWTSF
jgi:glucokinase